MDYLECVLGYLPERIVEVRLVAADAVDLIELPGSGSRSARIRELEHFREAFRPRHGWRQRLPTGDPQHLQFLRQTPRMGELHEPVPQVEIRRLHGPGVVLSQRTPEALERIRLRYQPEAARTLPSHPSQPLPERLPGHRNTDVQSHGEMGDVDPELQRGRRNHPPQITLAESILDAQSVRRLVPTPVWLDEAVVAGPHRQALSTLAGVDEGDETAVRRCIDKRLVHQLGHFGFSAVRRREVANRTLVPRCTVVLYTDRPLNVRLGRARHIE